ncbi:MAG TPA: Rpn family recombination-promoting nuclease/putative transposase [Phycisphaerae bacterium]|jgi:predicted transposase YdaD
MAESGAQKSLHPFWDRTIRFLLQRPDRLQAIMRLCHEELADRLDFSRLEVIERSFILDDYREREADLVVRLPYRAPDGERQVIVYLLLEHQSTVDRWMPLRLLFSMACLWDTQRREIGDAKRQLSPIIPMVFYTGSLPWTATREVRALVESPPELLRLVPHFDIMYLGLADVPAARLEGVGPVGWVLRSVQRIEAGKSEFADVLGRAARAIRALFGDEWRELASFLVALVTYRRPTEERDELQTVLQSAAADVTRRRELDQMSQTYAEYQFELGREKGREEAREALCDVILEQGTHRFGAPADEQRRRLETIRELPHLRALGRFILEAASWDELLNLE